jgi:ABC-type Co2+ transport system permease subunit
MAHSILALPTWLIGVLLVIVLPGVALAVQWGIRTKWPSMTRGDHNDVVGFIIAVVGVVYAVLLAFVVIVTWENFTGAEQVVGQEASALRSIYRESVAFPGPTQERLHALVLEYADDVTSLEWPAMVRGQQGDARVGEVLDRFAAEIAHAPVTTPNQQEFISSEAAQLGQLVSLRSRRLDFVNQGIPTVLWIAMMVGGIVTIGFAPMFGLERGALHSLMVGSLTALVGVLFFVAVVINYPFAGGVAVEPAPFDRVVADFSP